MMIRTIATFLLVLGLLWGLIDLGLFALFGGFFGNAPPTSPALIARAVLAVWWMFLGPLLMVTGSVVLLRGPHSKTGFLSALVCCLALTITMAYQTVLLIRNVADPLVAKPATLYVFYAIAVVVTVLADLGVARLYRQRT